MKLFGKIFIFLGHLTAVGQLGKLRGAELKLAKLILARSGRSLAHIRASLQAVAKMAVVDYF